MRLDSAQDKSPLEKLEILENIRVEKMLESTGRITKQPRSRTGVIWVPAELMIQEAFPFTVPCPVKITIDKKRLLVEEART